MGLTGSEETMLARSVDLFLRFYGHYVGYHPGKWRVFVKLYPFTRPTWKGKRIVKAGGCFFECDLQDFVQREIYYLGLEPYQINYLRKFIQPKWTVIDVGANCGYYSILLAKWVGKSGVVHAFEPSLGNLATLRRNLQLNPGTNVLVHNLALGEAAGFCNVEQPEAENLGTTRICAGSSVEMTTLDSFVHQNGISSIDFIKVDIEGYEMRFLSGASETLRKFHPPMLIEINPDALACFGVTPEDLEDRLNALNYNLFDFGWGAIKAYQRPPGRGWYRTVLALPRP